MKFIAYILKSFKHFLNSVTQPPENLLIICVHALHKFGNRGYRHMSHMSMPSFIDHPLCVGGGLKKGWNMRCVNN